MGCRRALLSLAGSALRTSGFSGNSKIAMSAQPPAIRPVMTAWDAVVVSP